MEIYLLEKIEERSRTELKVQLGCALFARVISHLQGLRHYFADTRALALPSS
jgi:hypothetical protein